MNGQSFWGRDSAPREKRVEGSPLFLMGPRACAWGSILVCFGFFVAFLSLEIFLRCWGPDWLKTRMREVGVENSTGAKAEDFGSDKNWPVVKKEGKFVQFKPQRQFRVQHYEYDIVAHIDQWGGRETRSSEDLKKERFMPFLGDSFTFGIGVKDEETYVSQLKAHLNYPFLNLGVPGSCLANQLDIIEFRHKDLGSPPVYIFNFFIGNDLTDLYSFRKYNQEKPDTADLSVLRASRSTQFLQAVNDFVRQNKFFRKVYFVQFFKSKFLILYNHYRVSKGITRRMDDDFFQTVIDHQHFKEMSDYLTNELDRLAILAKDLNFRPVFILIPDRHQVNRNLWRDKLEYYGLKEQDVDGTYLNKALGEALDSRHIPTIDVLDCMVEKSRKFPERKLYYTLDNHLTALGHEFVAQCAEVSLEEILQEFAH
ncbi:MAG: SGNH/GDSL hydrolase family protein [Planctomycetes bacterium]|nr:SGNH/GDSL hydrolase family protein [Planctomycetota bacterium]